MKQATLHNIKLINFIANNCRITINKLTMNMKSILMGISLLLIGQLSFGQYEQKGQNFEEPKLSNNFDTIKVKVGADIMFDFQGLTQHADTALIPLGSGFNLPAANLNLDGFLAKGVKVNMVVYLDSRHHEDSWVKGGYIQFDQLPFLNSTFADKIMNYLTIKVGDMELNYGDEHFRRTDNGKVIKNAFIGNYVMDAFTTSPSIEVLFRNNGWNLLGAVTTGGLDPALTTYAGKFTQINALTQLALYGKLGYDKQLSSDFRLRLSVSGYHSGKNNAGLLYGGDRAGSSFNLVMNQKSLGATAVDITANPQTGNYPGIVPSSELNSYMVNLLLRYYGLEIFGTIENATGTYTYGGTFNFGQLAAEGLYYFGGKQQFYGGVRYDAVSNNNNTMTVDRLSLVAGWFLTHNIIAKVEYVNETYNNFTRTYGADQAGFNGVMVEAAISF